MGRVFVSGWNSSPVKASLRPSRMILDVPAASLALRQLREGIVPVSTRTQTMAGFGFFAKTGCTRWWRSRTGGIALWNLARDTGCHWIRAYARPWSCPREGAESAGSELPGVVVEVKGPSYNTPRALRSLADFGTSWTRVLQVLVESGCARHGHGSVSRLSGPPAPWSSVREHRSIWEYRRAGGNRSCPTWP